MGEYVGRFAPSPSGPLHRGSLLAALASYVQARAKNGRWLVRIEDLDPPREPAGAARDILQCLALHHLQPDGAVCYQSQRHYLYQRALARLRADNRLYACACTRAQLRSARSKHTNPAYSGRCSQAELPEPGCALRLKLATDHHLQFEDIALGRQFEDLSQTCGDFVLRRRDGLYAYQLAVVVDDGEQGITEVVRGADLLDNTARQIHLQQALGLPQPSYLHAPLLLDSNGIKLSKQNHAPALDHSRPLENLQSAWRALGQSPLPQQKRCDDFLRLATSRWEPSRLTP